jgi:hypothetical protein
MGIEVPGYRHTDLLSWAESEQIWTDWIRKNEQHFGFDASKLILGHLLTSIGRYDNIFAISMNYTPKGVKERRESLLARMEWEIGTPELPEEIRQRLIEVKSKLAMLNWNRPKIYSEAQKLWLDKVQQFVIKQVEANPDYQEAVRYDAAWSIRMDLQSSWGKYYAELISVK